jgi:hypothetical protein
MATSVKGILGVDGYTCAPNASPFSDKAVFVRA